MKKAISCLFLIIFTSSVFGYSEDIREGYIYFGISFQRNKIREGLKKIITPNMLPMVMQQISSETLKNIGVDLLNEDVSKIFIHPQSYLDIYVKPKADYVVFRVTCLSDQMFIKNLRSILNKQWGNIRETKQGNTTRLFSSQPKQDKKELYYQIEKKNSVLIALDANHLVDFNQSKKIEISSTNKQKIEKILSDRPLLTIFMHTWENMDLNLKKEELEEIFNELSTIFFAVNESSKKITIDMQIEAKKNYSTFLQLPTFLENNPVFFLNYKINPEDVRKLIEKSNDPNTMLLINSLNLEQTLGDNFFISVQNFEPNMLIQGSFQGLDAIAGLAIKNSYVYENLLEVIYQKQLREQKIKPSKIQIMERNFYQFDSEENLGIKNSFYVGIIEDYLVVSTSRPYLEKIVNNVRQNKKQLLLPVSDKNIFLFADIARIVQKIPLLGMVEAQGLRVSNFFYLVGILEPVSESPIINSIFYFLFKE